MEREEQAGELCFGGGVRRACKVLANIVESIAAAVYIDCNFDLDAVWEVFRKILEPIITSDNLHEHPVSVLQKVCLKKMGKNPEYTRFREDSLWVVRAIVDANFLGLGSAKESTTAKVNAARAALETLRQFEADLSSVPDAGVAEKKAFSMDKPLSVV